MWYFAVCYSSSNSNANYYPLLLLLSFFKACIVPRVLDSQAGKTFQWLFFNIFVKFFVPHLSEGYTSAEDEGGSQTDVGSASLGESS
jgi:hypothetical protein